jgi:hypothetical protein
MVRIPDGTYEFLDATAAALSETRLSRQQARRIVRIIETAKSPALVPSALSTVDLTVGRLARRAVASPEPQGRLHQIALIVGIFAGLSTIVAGGLTSAYYLGYLNHIRREVQVPPDEDISAEILQKYVDQNRYRNPDDKPPKVPPKGRPAK